MNKVIQKLLFEHIKDLDWHSARESKEPFKWNTPRMNEMIAFGEYVLKNIKWESDNKSAIASHITASIMKELPLEVSSEAIYQIIRGVLSEYTLFHI